MTGDIRDFYVTCDDKSTQEDIDQHLMRVELTISPPPLIEIEMFVHEDGWVSSMREHDLYFVTGGYCGA